ncbi:hypothetical protein [Pseudomonas sp. CF161]|jgi:hypothetical protein|uniref:hypothetical protein n=1 Tax=Pseudomonas sp. CF161 TaxID=911241 RepID=UPI0003553360|nr:hypothetical protein [Pseudomonas sp. CF161]EPL03271.1 hypothetical protein CF161_31879 [Pseudomonas sp. CF161]
MSKLACCCGHVIVDQTDDLPYKASLLRDQEQSIFQERTQDSVKRLLQAVSNDGLEQLIAEQYGNTPWRPRPDELFQDQFTSIQVASMTCLYECQNCGRLWVQRAGSQQFASFAPDSGQYLAVLANPVPETPE